MNAQPEMPTHSEDKMRGKELCKHLQQSPEPGWKGTWRLHFFFKLAFHVLRGSHAKGTPFSWVKNKHKKKRVGRGGELILLETQGKTKCLSQEKQPQRIKAG